MLKGREWLARPEIVKAIEELIPDEAEELRLAPDQARQSAQTQGRPADAPRVQEQSHQVERKQRAARAHDLGVRVAASCYPDVLSGGRGTALAKGFAGQPNARITYVCDVDQRAVDRCSEAVSSFWRWQTSQPMLCHSSSGTSGFPAAMRGSSSNGNLQETQFGGGSIVAAGSQLPGA